MLACDWLTAHPAQPIGSHHCPGWSSPQHLNTEDGQGWDTAGQGYQGSGQDWEPGPVHPGKYWSDGFRTSTKYLKFQIIILNLFSEPSIWEIENIASFF